ncbi:energy-coupling factor transporter transmembrane component T family protein [Gynuella sp.]|uniref:energy-coupling factor transporter transmembrane component T family protein n=1 Tax=Gynuella sp. TaxID=2969146 RepID=UPI003D0AA16C
MISLYRHQPSWLHRIPAGAKIILLLVSSVLLFPVQQSWIQVAVLALIVASYASLGTRGLNHISVLRPMQWLLAAIFILQWWTTGPDAATALIVRMINMILLANLVTLTTRMEDMIATISPCFIPLKIFGIQPNRIAFAISLFIRFVPVLMATMNTLGEAWKARGGGYQRWKLIIPMMLITLKMSDTVAEAIATRGGISPDAKNN